jgi:rare lipoprotein A
MRNRLFLAISTLITSFLVSSFSFQKFERQSFSQRVVQDTIKPDSLAIIDSLSIEEGLYNFKLYKSKAHASYYANRFNGKRTASGQRFHNSKYTAAHRKLPFGTLVRVTNLRNHKTVMVMINDRGPHVRGREIDLTRTAFMKIARNKGGGEMIVKIEIAKKK